jgi:hypothetical protein
MEVIFWLGLCIAVGYFADKKGRSALGWGAGAFFFSPIIAGIILAISKDLRQESDIAQNAADQQQLRDRVEANEFNVNVRLQNVEKKVDRLSQSINNGNLINTNYTGALPPCANLPPSKASFCSNCGNKMSLDQKFCTKCGQKIS